MTQNAAPSSLLVSNHEIKAKKGCLIYMQWEGSLQNCPLIKKDKMKEKKTKEEKIKEKATKKKIKCFCYNECGHFKRDCPIIKKGLIKKKRVVLRQIPLQSPCGKNWGKLKTRGGTKDFKMNPFLSSNMHDLMFNLTLEKSKRNMEALNQELRKHKAKVKLSDMLG